MAQEIGRDFSFGAETHAAARGRESQVEEAGCRSEPRQGHAAGCAGKKELTLARLREWVRDQQARYGASERQVCFALRVSRSSFRYCSVAADDSALRLRIREITETRVHYGYRRVHVMLRREDLRDNHKRIYRLYSEQGLSLRLNAHAGINRHSVDSPSLRGCIRIMSGAWTLSLMPYLTGFGYVC